MNYCTSHVIVIVTVHIQTHSDSPMMKDVMKFKIFHNGSPLHYTTEFITKYFKSVKNSIQIIRDQAASS